MSIVKVYVPVDKKGAFPKLIRIPVVHQDLGYGRKRLSVSSASLNRPFREDPTFQAGVSYFNLHDFPRQRNASGPQELLIRDKDKRILHPVQLRVLGKSAFAPTSFTIEARYSRDGTKLNVPVVTGFSGKKLTITATFRATQQPAIIKKTKADLVNGVATPSITVDLQPGRYNLEVAVESGKKNCVISHMLLVV